MQKRIPFTALQRRLLLGCFIAYICVYLGRLNLSAALNDVMRALGADKAMGGALQTVFAVVYAAGQFVSGMLVDSLSPRKMILIGLSGAALCNLAFALGNAYWQLVALWALNGAFQSMLWTPIVRLLATYFEPEKRGSASFFMSFTLAGGHFAAWSLAGGMATWFGWRYSFAIPAAIMLLGVLATYLCIPGAKARALHANHAGNTVKTDAASSRMPIGVLFTTGLVPLLLCCVMNGFLRDGVITWAPTILKERAGQGALSESVLSLIIPLINLIGILFGRYCVHAFHRNTRTVAGLMMGACALPALALCVTPNAPLLICALLMGLVSALLYGTNPLFTTLMPLDYDGAGRVGLVAGLIDSFIYLGSALAGAFTGWLQGAMGGWTGIYACWAAVAVLSLGMSALSLGGYKKLASLPKR